MQGEAIGCRADRFRLYGRKLMRRSKPIDACPAETLLKLLRRRWATQLMKLVKERERLNYGAMKRALPEISSKVLTEQLRHLQNAGIFRRELTNGPRNEVFYSFTERGRELLAALDFLGEIAARWRREDAAAQ
jgi:DNA-binding HxlR family transcriptional regulator